MALAEFFQNPLLGNQSWSPSQGYDDRYYRKDGTFVGYHQGWDLVTPARIDPLTGTRIHADRVGDLVRAAGNGTVVYAGDPGHRWGKVVILQHELEQGFVLSIYAHLDEILVAAGDAAIGQPIGTMGNADGAHPTHLHFGMYLGEYDKSRSAFDFLGDGYLDAPDPSPNSIGWIDPEVFLAAHQNPAGESFIIGTAGDDNDLAAPGRTALYGIAGADRINGLEGADIIAARAGDDSIIVGGGGPDQIDGGAGNDYLFLDRYDLVDDQNIDLAQPGGFELTDGTTVTGIEWFDLRMGEGDDLVALAAHANRQTIDSGAGRDRIVLDYSASTGNVSFSRVSNVALSDCRAFVGTWDINRIFIENAEDFTVLGGSGDDRLDAQFMLTSILWGNAGEDRLYGTNGVDELYGGAGNDRIEGFNCFLGPDRLYGGAGNDTLVSAGDGAILNGGTGNDVMTGGTGGTRHDTFVFQGLFGKDRITDFEAGPGDGDRINLAALDLTLADLRITSVEFGLSTRITVKATGDSILLSGVALASLDLASDIIL